MSGAWRVPREILLIAPTLPINAVNAEKLNPALFQVLTQRGDQAVVFPIVKAAHSWGKGYDARARLAKYQHFHVAMQGFTLVSVVLLLYAGGNAKLSGGMSADLSHRRYLLEAVGE